MREGTGRMDRKKVKESRKMIIEIEKSEKETQRERVA